ncbi:MAG TPA: VOC family protein [Terriglobales bacterium]|nr:VOC family protein [Terriglobales bacterium]
MKLNAYVNFAGRCAEAFRYYEKHLGAKNTMLMTFGQAPDQTHIDPKMKDTVMHGRTVIAGEDLLGADIPNAEPMRSAYLTITVDSDAEAERIYAALADGGAIFMKMESTFFATRFGQLRDRFGVNWMIINPRPMQPPR